MPDKPISKDTIYVDVDDEITAIIDKVRSSKSDIVALVLPKRASVFQSVVNMKLLKRSAEQESKKLALITTEASLLPLAGSVGLHVAKTLTSKPEIPDSPLGMKPSDEPIETTEDLTGDDEDEEKPQIDLRDHAEEPVGDLAAVAGLPLPPKADDVETVELNNEDESPVADKTEEAKKTAKPKKNKSMKVPNFNRFRLLLILGLPLLVILIILFILAIKVFPRATINIQTDASTVNTSLSFSLSTTASSLDTVSNTVPAKQVSQNKPYTATQSASGSQNNGTQATGTINMTAEYCGNSSPSSPVDAPAGTGVSLNGLTYITQSDTSFGPIHYDPKSKCYTSSSNSSTNITAQSGGAKYNTTNNNQTFAVDSQGDGYVRTAVGGASGGTDNIQTIVLQSDITAAEAKISPDTNSIKQALESQLEQSNLYPLPSTFVAGTPSISPSVSAGAVANSVTINETIGYTMYGVRKSDLQTLLNSAVNSQTSNHQSILNDGLSSATYNVSGTSVSLQTVAEVGPNINTSLITSQIEGKKSADVQSIIKTNPNVTGVTVNYSPFYVDTVPNSPSKIKIIIAKPKGVNTNGSTST